MARRMLAWGLVTPVAAAGILVAHALAYRLTGTAPGPVHGYLEHGPQVLCVLAARRLAGSLTVAHRARSIGRGEAWLPLSERPESHPRVVHHARPTGRGPPLLAS